MSSERSLLGARSHEIVYDAFRDHSSRSRVSTEFFLLDFLRQSYPDFHVTCTSKSNWDFKGFAEAGNAKVELVTDDQFMHTCRMYVSPGPRMDTGTGRVVDAIHFGRWNYTWKGTEFIIYEAGSSDSLRPKPSSIFILARHADAAPPHDEISLTDQLIIAIGDWSTILHDEIYVFDNGYWSKSSELWESVQGSSWDEVILNQDMKSNIISDVVGFFDNKALYKELAVPWKRGLIFHGVPGNGKTISIKTLISALAARKDPVPSLYVKSFDARNGQNVSIRSIFTHARTMAPCLLIFEDLDSLANDQNRSYLLNEVDGLESNDGILMIGSTNHLDSLDPAISKRPSRFDRKYHFKLPDEEEREAYAKYWMAKLEHSDMVDFPKELCAVIAKISEGFSFAYLKELFVIALLTIARGGTGDEESEKPVIVNRSDAFVSIENSEDFEEKGDEETSAQAPKKRTIPEVEIPEELKNNVLLKVLRAHLKTLLDEMDNTDENKMPSEKNVAGGIPRGQPAMPVRHKRVVR